MRQNALKTKEAGGGGAPTIAEVKASIAQLGSAFDEFKEANDQRIKELESKGQADPVLNEKVDKLSQAVGEASALKQKLEKQQARVDELEAMANRLGPQGKGQEGPPEVREHLEAVERFVRSGSDDGLRDAEVKMLGATYGKKAASTLSDPDGGYLLPEAVVGTIDRLLTKDSAMRSVSTVRSIGAAKYKKLVGVGGSTSGWVGEKDARPETATPKFVGLEFDTHEVYSQPGATQTLLDDAFVNVAAWLADEVSIDFAEQEGDAFISGDGVAKPFGLLAYPTVANSSWAWGKVGFVKTGVNGAFKAVDADPADCLIELVHALPRKLRAGGGFLMNDSTCMKVRLLKDTDHNYLWRPGLEQGQPDRLLGYGISYDDYMPDMATGSLSIAFGNFRRAYLILDRMGVRLLRDPYTQKPYILFYTTKRVGGGVQDFQAYKLLKFAA